MRVAFILLVVVGAFACSQAQGLDLKELGTTLVKGLVDKAKDALKEAGQSLLGKLTGLIGKREGGLLSGLTSKLGDLLEHGKKLATTAFGKAVDKLKELTGKFHEKLGLLKDAQEYTDAVDDVVAEHHVLHKRILADLVEGLKGLASSLVEKGKGILSGLKDTASSALSSLLQHGTDLLVGKRATLSDHLSTIGKAISGAVSPFKDIVAGLGSQLKGHFSNLVSTVKGHVDALKGKLAGHVTDLKTHGSKLLEHGKNALGALSGVVSDILKQTLSNAGPTIDDLAKTAAGAGKTIVDHLSGADKTF